MSTELNHARAGHGRPLVLLHPVGLDLQTWGALAGVLDGFELVAVDLPGHGGSPLGSATSLDDHADRLASLLDALRLDRPVVLGLSFGGMVAQGLAIRRPDALSALVLAGCPSTFPDAARLAIAERGARALHAGMEAVLDETLARWFTPGYLAQRGADGTAWRLRLNDPANWAATWAAIARLDNGRRLGAVRVPTLCLSGELDLAVPTAMVQALAEAIPGALQESVKGAPHMMHVERPAETARAVARFLAGA